MEKFGVLKSKILKKLTESYANGNKDEMKDLLLFLKENKDFKELYLFYEEIEKLELSYPDSAQLYLETVEPLLMEKSQLVKNAYDKISKYVDNVESEKNELYECLDILSEQSNLNNIEKKIVAKKKLIEHLMEEKPNSTPNNSFTKNESLLYSVLVDNFNDSFSQNINEEDKKELMDILSMTNEDVTNKTKELKESIFKKIDLLSSTSTDAELKEKLSKVKYEVIAKNTSKYNYYKLKELEREL